MPERPLRVLWCLQLQPAAVRRRLGAAERHGPAAWIESLRLALRGRPEVVLGIVSPGAEDYEPFEEDGVVFMNSPVVSGGGGRVRRIADRWEYALRANESWNLRSAIDRFHPDLVHVHGTEHAFGLAAVGCGVPAVVSLQGLPTACARFFLTGLTVADVVRMGATTDFLRGTSVLHEYSRMRARAARERRIVAGHRFFIGRTLWDRAVVQSLNPDARYVHCDEIMRPPFYRALWKPRGEAAPVIFSTSGTMIYKGSECLLEAAAILVRCGFPDLEVRIAGVPEEGQVARFYRRRAVEVGIADHVRWVGRMTADGLVREILSSDVFAYPSRVDNSPNALVEAMMVGAPVVASCVGGISSLVTDGADGLLFTAGDPWALAGQLRRLLESPDVAAQMGMAARKRALVRNDPGRVTEATIGIYRDVAAQSTT